MRTIVFALFVVIFCTTTAFAGPAGFRDNGNGTVTDITTNLMWQQCTAGWSGAGCATDDLAVANRYTWGNAITYCEGLPLGGFSDWRLPNIKELKSIEDVTTYSPAINAVYFPNTASSPYWSSTTNMFGTTFAWSVNFNYGAVRSIDKTSTNYVLCVRGQ